MAGIEISDSTIKELEYWQRKNLLNESGATESGPVRHAAMTLTERKMQMEREILKLLVSFVAETGLGIDRIDLETTTTYGDTMAQTPINVTVGVEL